MGDGFSETNNRHTGKGRWLRSVGDEHGDKPEYSDDLDYQVGSTSLNAHGVYMDESEQKPPTTRKKLRGETGLIIKEPLV